MGLAKKLAKRTQRLARVRKAKDAKKDQRLANEIHYIMKHREHEVYDMAETTWKDTQTVLYTALHERYGFGGKRLRRLFREVSDLQELIADNDGSEGDMFRQFAEETHYNITPPTAEIDDDDSIKLRSIGRITGYFFWTLRDKFGFGKGRLKELSRVCGAIGDDLKEGRRTIQGMKDELNRIDGFWLGGRDAS